MEGGREWDEVELSSSLRMVPVHEMFLAQNDSLVASRSNSQKEEDGLRCGRSARS